MTVAALLAGALLAQATLALTICFLSTSRITRWRPLWLALPAAIGLGLALSAGLQPAICGYLAVPGAVLRHLAGTGTPLFRFGQIRAVVTAWRVWVPAQLPVALVAAAAVTALTGWLGRAGRAWPYRPGALVAVRAGYHAATLRRGELATSDGSCLGVCAATGRRVAVSWRSAEAGMLCTGRDVAAVTAIGRDMTLAAIQHRKAVLVIDLADRDGDLAGDGTLSRGTRARTGACQVGGCDAGVTDQLIVAECARVGAPLLRFGTGSAGYDPLSGATTARAVKLVIAMIDWDGIGAAPRQFCARYLHAALTVLPMTPPGTWRPGCPLFDQLAALLVPGALAAAADRLSGHRSAAVRSLVSQVGELAGRSGADDTAIRLLAAQLAELRAAPAGQVLCRPGQRTLIDLRQALAIRAVAHFRLGLRDHGRPAAMIARLAVADLIDGLTEHAGLGCRSDCLIWINGCAPIESSRLAELAGIGSRAGAAVVLGTTAPELAADLAAQLSVIAVAGDGPLVDSPGQAGQTGTRGPRGLSLPGALSAGPAMLRGPGRPDALSLWTGRDRPAHIADCEVVR